MKKRRLLTFHERGIEAYAVPTRASLEWVGDDSRAALEGVGREAAEYWNHYGQVDGMANLPLGSMPSMFHMRELGSIEDSLA
ncbi:MAG TPA: hypothetical protein VFK41_09415 [Nocardioidaceae bacterium]|nr:hypothetical protein [Nocardioidaceae bacterium]